MLIDMKSDISFYNVPIMAFFRGGRGREGGREEEEVYLLVYF